VKRERLQKRIELIKGFIPGAPIPAKSYDVIISTEFPPPSARSAGFVENGETLLPARHYCVYRGPSSAQKPQSRVGIGRHLLR
jgi:hypothetical protein